MASVSEIIATWIDNCNYDELPIEIIEIAKRNILDCVGTALAGSKEPVAHVLDQYLSEIGGDKQATVLGLGVKSACSEAAMANGILSHALDYDDLVIPATGAGGPHITAAVLPAALAVAEYRKKTGKDLILAYVIGCETAYRIGRAVDPTHYNAGWHTTGTVGIFGGVAAAGKLLELDDSSIAFAHGIAASEASGLRENFGTMTKFLHAGQAAGKGVRAALLAKCGFESSKRIFEGKSGFCNVFTKEPKIEEVTKDLEQYLCLPQIRLKLYPCCAGSHAAIYATGQIMKEATVETDDINEIKVFCDPQMRRVLTFDQPENIDEAKFSVQFPVALVCMQRKVTLSEFTTDNLNDPDIQNLMRKIKLIPQDELKAKSVHSRTAVVEIVLKDGRKFVNRCDHPPGTPQNKIGEGDIYEKYQACAEQILKADAIEKVFEQIMSLEKIDNLDDLLTIAGKTH
ncbi:MAG: MmgE/PrpD family protein [Deltaproteobacteria bacterium]|nr:MAG: MmgE/PrpD family protein [Deltaproteobacteria bacterium]